MGENVAPSPWQYGVAQQVRKDKGINSSSQTFDRWDAFPQVSNTTIGSYDL